MNHYANSTHAELRISALQEAGALRFSAKYQQMVKEGKYVTRAQRGLIRSPEAFGADRTLADLLEALADQVHHGRYIPGDAEQLLEDPAASLLSVFGPKLAEQQRNARHLVVLQAADLVLRTYAATWLHGGETGQSPYERALASNSGLAAVLQELEARRKR